MSPGRSSLNVINDTITEEPEEGDGTMMNRENGRIERENDRVDGSSSSSRLRQRKTKRTTSSGEPVQSQRHQQHHPSSSLSSSSHLDKSGDNHPQDDNRAQNQEISDNENGQEGDEEDNVSQQHNDRQHDDGDHDSHRRDYNYNDEEEDEDDRPSNLGNWHYFPIAIAVVPPVLSVFHGRSEMWTDFLLLLLVAFYLYHIVRSPWDIYYDARTRRIMAADNDATQSNMNEPKYIQSQRKNARTELRFFEIMALALTLASPIFGAMLLYALRDALHDPDRYINPFSVKLFVLAAGIKPWGHFLRLVRKRTLFLQEQVHYPSAQVKVLDDKVQKLEKIITQLTKDTVRSQDLDVLLKQGVDAPLGHVIKAVRRNSTREERNRHSTDEKLLLLHTRIDNMSNQLTENEELLDRIASYSSYSISGLVFNLFQRRLGLKNSYTNTSSSQNNRENTSYTRWYARGPLYFVFFPLNITHRVLDVAFSTIYNAPSHIMGPSTPTISSASSSPSSYVTPNERYPQKRTQQRSWN